MQREGIPTKPVRQSRQCTVRMPWHDIVARAEQGSFDSALAHSRLAQDDSRVRGSVGMLSNARSYFPMQKLPKMRFKMSSAVVAPVISSSGRKAL